MKRPIQPASPITLTLEVMATRLGMVFAWIPSDEPTAVSFSANLSAPFWSAQWETIIAKRGSDVIRKGVIRHLPRGDEGNFFWDNEPPTGRIAASEFQDGDRIFITSLPPSDTRWPSPFFERNYWVELMGITRSDLCPFYLTPKDLE